MKSESLRPKPQGLHGAVVAFLSLVACSLLPAVVAGIAAGECLRRRRLHWSWALLPAVVLLPFGVVAAAHYAPPLAAEPRVVVDHPAKAALSVLVPCWMAAVCPVAVWWKAKRDYRARLQGGLDQRSAENPLTPAGWFRRRRDNAVIVHGPDAGSVLLGIDDRDQAVVIPTLSSHATIVGGSDTGKTNTASVLLEDHVASGAGFIVLDGKGGRSLARTAVQLGARHGRPVALWSIIPYGAGAADLDALRLPWNVTGDGNATEIKDRIAATEDQTEPYYAAVAARGLLLASRALLRTSGVVRLDELAACMENHERLLRTVVAAGGEDAASVRWARTLGDAERSGLRGMGLRLRTMVSSDGGEWLLPSNDGREISLYRAITERWLVVFTLPQGLYPELIPQVARYALQTINSVCTRLEGEGVTADSLLLVDEFSALDGDELSASYERARSAGIRVITSTQSFSNFESAGGTKLRDAALDNSELLIVHRQNEPDAAELLARVAGTEETWEHTHQVQDGGAMLPFGVALGRDESGQRARRRTDQFLIHPNIIKNLGQGTAAVISRRDTRTAQVVRIRPGLTASRGS